MRCPLQLISGKAPEFRVAAKVILDDRCRDGHPRERFRRSARESTAVLVDSCSVWACLLEGISPHGPAPPRCMPPRLPLPATCCSRQALSASCCCGVSRASASLRACSRSCRIFSRFCWGLREESWQTACTWERAVSSICFRRSIADWGMPTAASRRAPRIRGFLVVCVVIPGGEVEGCAGVVGFRQQRRCRKQNQQGECITKRLQLCHEEPPVRQTRF